MKVSKTFMPGLTLSWKWISEGDQTDVIHLRLGSISPFLNEVYPPAAFDSLVYTSLASLNILKFKGLSFQSNIATELSCLIFHARLLAYSFFSYGYHL